MTISIGRGISFIDIDKSILRSVNINFGINRLYSNIYLGADIYTNISSNPNDYYSLTKEASGIGILNHVLYALFRAGSYIFIYDAKRESIQHGRCINKYFVGNPGIGAISFGVSPYIEYLYPKIRNKDIDGISEISYKSLLCGLTIDVYGGSFKSCLIKASASTLFSIIHKGHALYKNDKKGIQVESGALINGSISMGSSISSGISAYAICGFSLNTVVLKQDETIDGIKLFIPSNQNVYIGLQVIAII